MIANMGERDPDSFNFSFADTARGLTRAEHNVPTWYASLSGVLAPVPQSLPYRFPKLASQIAGRAGLTWMPLPLNLVVRSLILYFKSRQFGDQTLYLLVPLTLLVRSILFYQGYCGSQIRFTQSGFRAIHPFLSLEYALSSPHLTAPSPSDSSTMVKTPLPVNLPHLE